MTTRNRIGVGTTDPQFTLDVAGDLNVTGNFLSNGEDASGALYWSETAAENIITSANVGIGMTEGEPLEPLHVAGNARIDGNLIVQGTQTIINTEVEATTRLEVTNSGTGPAVLVNQTGAQPVADFQDDGVSSLFIADGGNVGIGTNNPTQRLHVNGESRFGGRTIHNNRNFYRIDPEGNVDTLLDIDFPVVTDKIAGIRFFRNTNTTGACNFSIFRGNNLTGAQHSFDATGDSYVQRFTGNFGIGTTNPTSRLHVRGSSGDENTTTLLLNGPNTGPKMLMIHADSGNSTSDVQAGIGFSNHGGSSFASQSIGSLRRGINGFGDLLFMLRNNSEPNEVTTSDEKMRIAANGNVGIGTNNPTQRLHVTGRMAIQNGDGFTPQLNFISGPNNTNPWRIRANVNDSTNLGLQFEENTTTLMAIRSGGNVGIGTTNPQHRLDIGENTSNTVDETVRIRSRRFAGLIVEGDSANLSGEPGGAYVQLSQDGGLVTGLLSMVQSPDQDGSGGSATGTLNNSMYLANLYDDVSGHLQFGTRNTVRMTIRANGNVGIGVTNPSERLHVDGNILSSGNVSILAAGRLMFSGPTDNNWSIYRAETSDFTKSLATSHTLNINAHSGVNQGFAIGRNGGLSYYEILGHASSPTHFLRGNVGIGVTNPVSRLHVDGNLLLNGNIEGRNGFSEVVYNGDDNVNAKFSVSARSNGILNTGNQFTFFPCNFFIHSITANNSDHGFYSITGNYSICIARDTATERTEIHTGNLEIVFERRRPSPRGLLVKFTDTPLSQRPGVMIGSHQWKLNWDLPSSESDSGRLQLELEVNPIDETATNVGGNVFYNFEGSLMYSGVNRAKTVIDNTTFRDPQRHQGTNTDDALSAFTIEGGDIVVSGNVGIGVTNPGSRLHVSGNPATGGNSVAVLNGANTGTDAAQEGLGILYVNDQGTTTGAKKGIIFSRIDNRRVAAIQPSILSDGGSDLDFFTSPAGQDNNLTRVMRMTGSGNVGIGVTNPGVRLQVDGTTRSEKFEVGNQVLIDSTPDQGRIGYVSSGLHSLLAYSNGNVEVAIDFNNSSTTRAFIVSHNSQGARSELMRVQENGRVGIGTNNPPERLSVHGDGNVYIEARNVGANRRLLMGSETTQNSIYSRHATSNDPEDFRIVVGSSEAMRITSSGNVGIGVTNPSEKLVVDDGANAQAITMQKDGFFNDQNQALLFRAKTSGTPSGSGRVTGGIHRRAVDLRIISRGDDSRVLFYTGGTENSGYDMDVAGNPFSGTYTSSNDIPKMAILSNGNVGIGTNNPTERLHVHGDMRIDKDMTMTQMFDYTNVWQSSQTEPQQNIWNSVTWSSERGLFVAVASSGTSRVMTSPDGDTWTPRTAAQANDWRSVTWSSERGLFVAVASSGTNRVMTSPDGITWQSRTAAQNNAWWSVIWAPEVGLFVAVAASGTNRVMTSSDGITWLSVPNTPPEAGWRSVTWSAYLGLFVAVGNATNIDGTRVMTSADGKIWSRVEQALSNDWSSVTWSPLLKRFVAVSNAGFLSSQRVMTSKNGTSWSIGFTPQISLLSVVWVGDLELFVAVGGNSSVVTSNDGIQWQLNTLGTIDFWQSVVWATELKKLVAVASTGTNRAFVSTAIFKDYLTNTTGQTMVVNGTLQLGEARLEQPSGDAPLYAARAWVRFDGTAGGSGVTIKGSANVSSVTIASTGQYTISFATAMPNADYTYVGIARSGDGFSGRGRLEPHQTILPTTTSFRVVTNAIQNVSGERNSPDVYVVVFA